MSPRTGRPKIEKPLSNDVKVRLDDETHEKLLEYCDEKGLSKAEVIRSAILSFLERRK